MTTKRIKCRDFALWLRHTTSNTNANMNTTANVNANEYWYPVIFECALMRSLRRVHMYIVCLMALTDFLLFSHELKAHVRCARQNSIKIITKKKWKNINNDNIHREHTQSTHMYKTTTTVFAAPDNCNMKYHNRKSCENCMKSKELANCRLCYASWYPVVFFFCID